MSCFYLFSIPYEWTKYFAFRKTIKRKVLGGPGDPEEDLYLASRVIPMGWSAAVTVVQHLHRELLKGWMPVVNFIGSTLCLKNG